MPNVTASLPLIVAFAAGLFVGALLLYLLALRWRAQAHAEGQARRDAEVATLIEQRDAGIRRADESAARKRR